ncbi:MAG: hypothetical protein IK032_02810 [Bacteroidales bacterium]|nr:hypothetical protein [Bacteroidales bacterium]MBR5028331.1 hypothetical protein [Bacteroidales bacterium]
MFWYFIIGLIILYVVYRLCATTIFPMISERRMKKYRDEFLKNNPQIDKDKLPPLKNESSKKRTHNHK